MGIVHAINLTRDFIKNANFIVFFGDNYLNDELSFLYDADSSDEMDGIFTLTKV